jgi:hypothetical protein
MDGLRRSWTYTTRHRAAAISSAFSVRAARAKARTDRIGRAGAWPPAGRWPCAPPLPSIRLPLAAPSPPQSGVAGSENRGIPTEDGCLLLLPLRRPCSSAVPEPRQERGALPQRRHAGGRWCRLHLQGNQPSVRSQAPRCPLAS